MIFVDKNVQAEFLLFECLQDITGGELLFVLGMQVRKISVKDYSISRLFKINRAFTANMRIIMAII